MGLDMFDTGKPEFNSFMKVWNASKSSLPVLLLSESKSAFPGI